MALLGITLTVWNAFDEGESIHTHLVHSFVSNLYWIL